MKYLNTNLLYMLCKKEVVILYYNKQTRCVFNIVLSPIEWVCETNPKLSKILKYQCPVFCCARRLCQNVKTWFNICILYRYSFLDAFHLYKSFAKHLLNATLERVTVVHAIKTLNFD